MFLSSILVLLFLLFSPNLACNCGDTGPLPSTDPFDPLGPWHQRHLDCGIPPFAYRLPQEAQAKIHSIWVKYQAGDECEEEQEQTRAIIMGIPEEVPSSPILLPFWEWPSSPGAHATVQGRLRARICEE
jgi:hypothetical protein